MPWPSCICTGLQSYQPHFSWHMPRPSVRWHGRDANWSQMGLQSFLWKAWNKNGQHRAWPGLDREAGLDIAPLLDGGLHASQEIFRLLSSDQIGVHSGKAASAKPKQSLIRICLRPSPANPSWIREGFQSSTQGGTRELWQIRFRMSWCFNCCISLLFFHINNLWMIFVLVTNATSIYDASIFESIHPPCLHLHL